MIEDPSQPLGRIGVLDIETAPDPQALALLHARPTKAVTSVAVHRIVALSTLRAEERSDASWHVFDLQSTAQTEATSEIDMLVKANELLTWLTEDDGMLATYNGKRHDLLVLRRRSARHLLFDLEGIQALPSIWHHDLMVDAMTTGKQWFSLRDHAAGLGIPVAHQVPGKGLGPAHATERKGQVDVAATFLVLLYDLALRRGTALPVTSGWRALGDAIRRMGTHGEHLAQFRRSLHGRGSDE